MAIAFDATAHGDATATSLTFSHTCTGSNRILWVGVRQGSNSDFVTGITYNSVSMTLAVKKNAVAGTMWEYLYYLVNPATGANNVVVSASSSVRLTGVSASYTGANQTGQPDATGSNAATGTSITTSVTVVNPSWTISFAGNDGALAMTGSTGVGAVRDNGSWVSNLVSLGDSNATVSTGSQSMIWTSSSQTIGVVMASFSYPSFGGSFLFNFI